MVTLQETRQNLARATSQLGSQTSLRQSQGVAGMKQRQLQSGQLQQQKELVRQAEVIQKAQEEEQARINEQRGQAAEMLTLARRIQQGKPFVFGLDNEYSKDFKNKV